MQTFGNYSPYRILNSTVYIAGQVGVDEYKNAPQTLDEQFKIIINNIASILSEAGSSLENVVAIRVYLTDIGLFDEFNKLYSNVFKDNLPVRECIEVSALPPVAKNDNKLLIEISAVAKAN